LIDKVLCGFDRINGVTLGRTRLEKRVVSQDLELWLANVRFTMTATIYSTHLICLMDFLESPHKPNVDSLHCLNQSLY
jgi:hypothetical protein